MPLCLVPRLSIQTSLLCSCRCFSRSSARQSARVRLCKQSPASQEGQGPFWPSRDDGMKLPKCNDLERSFPFAFSDNLGEALVRRTIPSRPPASYSHCAHTGCVHVTLPPASRSVNFISLPRCSTKRCSPGMTDSTAVVTSECKRTYSCAAS